MNIERLEKMIELLERPLPKTIRFNMAYFGNKDFDEFNQVCGTSGCIGHLLSTDSYFTDLGYECNIKQVVNERDESYYTAFPTLSRRGHIIEGGEILEELFDISLRERMYIFFSWGNGNTKEAAAERVRDVINKEIPFGFQS